MDVVALGLAKAYANSRNYGEELAAAELTSQYSTTSTGLLPINGLAATIVADGKRLIEITVELPSVTCATAGTNAQLAICEGATVLRQCFRGTPSNGAQIGPLSLTARIRPSAGVHLYSAKLASGTSTVAVTVAANATSIVPLFKVVQR